MIFLSASIPDSTSIERYAITADAFAIKEAVSIFCSLVIPNTSLVFGGHPSIVPIVKTVMNSIKWNVKDQVTLYQSHFFHNPVLSQMPSLGNTINVKAGFERKASLLDMRNLMLTQHKFTAGVFIGGMKGVEEEYVLFKQHHPNALVLPIASTGAAARNIYYHMYPRLDSKLLNDYSYAILLKSFLRNII